ncbi:hypothetical protein Btru_020183 [Bulinus truncatus]|nr:hypothetical protein Btru_020183 [Bulinus truncatus]
MIEILRPQETGAFVSANESDARGPTTFLYICRLWRQFDGRLNPEGLKLILTRVMTYLMVHPGCPLVKICHVLNPDILPSTTMDAVDILESLGCIQIIRVEKLKPPDMFSRRSRTLTISDDLVTSDCVRTIDVQMDGPMKLSYFLDTAFKHAAKLAETQTGQ